MMQEFVLSYHSGRYKTSDTEYPKLESTRYREYTQLLIQIFQVYPRSPIGEAFPTHFARSVAVAKIFKVGVAYMLPKSGPVSDPKNYRIVTYLPTLYKIFTSDISSQLYVYLTENNILDPKQFGCRKESR
jgi:hypothetical protein